MSYGQLLYSLKRNPQQASSSLETGALRYCPSRTGSKSGWVLYHQRPQDLGVAIQQRHHEGFHLKGMVMDM